MNERVPLAGHGRLVTLEGGDGAGKSTHAGFVARWLEERGCTVHRTREPGGTPLGEALRRIVLERDRVAIGADAETLLIFAARAQHLEEVIEPHLRAGSWVVCDRFTDATYAYQGGGRGLAPERIALLEQWVQGTRRPDLTLLLDVAVEVGLHRAGQRSGSDRFEAETRRFKEAVRQAYLDGARRWPERVRVIDAGQPLPDVERQIEAELRAFLERVTHGG